MEETEFAEEDMTKKQRMSLLKGVDEEWREWMEDDIWNYSREDMNRIVHLKEYGKLLSEQEV